MSANHLTDEQLATLLLSKLLPTLGREVGAVRLPRVLIVAALKLTVDLDGEAAAWEGLREALATATERARRAAHPGPRSVG